MTDNLEADHETIEFPGLTEPDVSSGLHGVKPIAIGPAVIKIYYSGAKVLVDVHIKKLPTVGAKDFRQMQLSAGHLKDHASVSYTMFKREVTVNLEAIPAERVVVLKFSGAKEIVSHFPSKPIRIPYLPGPYPFPDVSGLRHPRSYTKTQVEEMIAKGVWHELKTELKGQSKYADGSDLVTMLGGGPWLEKVRGVFAKKGVTASNSGPDVLIAIGARAGSGTGPIIGDGGFGFFYKPGLIEPEYIGLFTMGHAGIGAALEASAELYTGIYWGSADQTALEAFSSTCGFFRVSAADVLDVSVDFVVSGSPHLRLCGLNFGGGLGAGVEVAGGVQGVGEVHVDT